jgi:quercetin dioxygenase-like cupin family protein
MGHLEDIRAVEPFRVWDAVIARSVEGERVSFAVVELDPSAHVPEHSHENEQLGVVLSGTITFRVGDETRDLAAGGTWRIPPNVPHEAHAGDAGAVVLDVFAPVREDWASLERLGDRTPLWP